MNVPWRTNKQTTITTNIDETYSFLTLSMENVSITANDFWHVNC